MDDDGLPAESATAIEISTDFAFYQYTIFLLYLKSNKNAMSVRKTRTFQQMVVNTMQLLIFCYSCKYTDWSINSIKWKTIFSNALSSSTIRKWGQFLKTLRQKLQKLLFSMWMDMLWQIQKATGSWKYLSVDLQCLMFNSNLKHNIKPTTSFQDT